MTIAQTVTALEGEVDAHTVAARMADMARVGEGEMGAWVFWDA